MKVDFSSGPLFIDVSSNKLDVTSLEVWCHAIHFHYIILRLYGWFFYPVQSKYFLLSEWAAAQWAAVAHYFCTPHRKLTMSTCSFSSLCSPFKPQSFPCVSRHLRQAPAPFQASVIIRDECRYFPSLTHCSWWAPLLPASMKRRAITKIIYSNNTAFTHILRGSYCYHQFIKQWMPIILQLKHHQAINLHWEKDLEVVVQHEATVAFLVMMELLDLLGCISPGTW